VWPASRTISIISGSDWTAAKLSVSIFLVQSLRSVAASFSDAATTLR
jgi:hypothetical protein